MQNQPIEEPVKEYLARLAIDTLNASEAARERTVRLVALLATLYRIVVVAVAGARVWCGGSAWLLCAAIPLLWFAPKISR